MQYKLLKGGKKKSLNLNSDLKCSIKMKQSKTVNYPQ